MWMHCYMTYKTIYFAFGCEEREYCEKRKIENDENPKMNGKLKVKWNVGWCDIQNIPTEHTKITPDLPRTFSL